MAGMQPAAPVHVLDLFEDERGLLLKTLNSLSPAEWLTPTVCAGWSVKDIAAHLVADDLGPVSRGRDGWTAGFIDVPSFEELVAAINAQNEAWVASMRRLSPQVVHELLRFSGPRVFAEYGSCDLKAPGPPVDWAAPGPAAMWLHIAREYTERWLHSRQIYDAIAAVRGIEPAPESLERRLLFPVLDTFARSLPRAYAGTVAPEGTHVRVVVKGEAGCAWSVVRMKHGWALMDGVSTRPAATVTLDQDTAWRMYTRGLPPDAVRSRALIEGDAALGAVALTAVAILA